MASIEEELQAMGTEDDAASGGSSSEGKPATPAQAKQERRDSPRYIARWRAALVNPANGDVRYLGRTDNVSIQGVAIISDNPVPPKQDYHLYLEIPQAAGKAPLVLEMFGRVTYSTLSSNSFRVGVAIKQHHGDAEQVLRALMASGKLKPLANPMEG